MGSSQRCSPQFYRTVSRDLRENLLNIILSKARNCTHYAKTFTFLINSGVTQANQGFVEVHPTYLDISEKATNIRFFVFKRNVILECPVYGNAAYILEGTDGWHKAFKLSRRELLSQYGGWVPRVIHTGDWNGRLRS